MPQDQTMMPQDQTRTARVEARIAPDALAIVKRAAEIQGRSVSDFMVAAAQDVAANKDGSVDALKKVVACGDCHDLHKPAK